MNVLPLDEEISARIRNFKRFEKHLPDDNGHFEWLFEEIGSNSKISLPAFMECRRKNGTGTDEEFDAFDTSEFSFGRSRHTTYLCLSCRPKGTDLPYEPVKGARIIYRDNKLVGEGILPLDLNLMPEEEFRAHFPAIHRKAISAKKVFRDLSEQERERIAHLLSASPRGKTTEISKLFTNAASYCAKTQARCPIMRAIYCFANHFPEKDLDLLVQTHKPEHARKYRITGLPYFNIAGADSPYSEYLRRPATTIGFTKEIFKPVFEVALQSARVRDYLSGIKRNPAHQEAAAN